MNLASGSNGEVTWFDAIMNLVIGFSPIWLFGVIFFVMFWFSGAERYIRQQKRLERQQRRAGRRSI